MPKQRTKQMSKTTPEKDAEAVPKQKPHNKIPKKSPEKKARTGVPGSCHQNVR